jgi:cytochrome bd-I ubiquinol oxidase subunit X
MWYFSWILGVGFAGAFSILNAMWLELSETPSQVERRAPEDADSRHT